MHIQKRFLLIFGLLLLLAGCFVTFRSWQNSRVSTLTVSASFRQINKSRETDQKFIKPDTAAQIASGNYEASFRPLPFINGTLRTGLAHGPIKIKGFFPCKSIQETFPSCSIDDDWPFTVSFYNTSTGRVFHFYLDVTCDPITEAASADLYIFGESNAHPLVAHWEGYLGNAIDISPEHMEI